MGQGDPTKKIVDLKPGPKPKAAKKKPEKPPTLEQEGPSFENKRDAQICIVPTSQEKLKLYEENAKVAAIFWEWRHKVLTYFSTAVAAIFVVAGWLYDKGFGKLAAAPFFLGTIVSIVSILLDGRNKKILNAAYRVGEELECEMCGQKGAIFRSLSEALRQSGEKVTYTTIFRVAFGAIGILFLILSILTLVLIRNRPV